MTPAIRAFLGAAIGAVCTLVVHPTSRPFLSLLLQHQSPDVLATTLDYRTLRLPPPEDLYGAALWEQMAADRIVSGHPLTAKEERDVLRIASAAGRKEPDNAYWNQIRAVLLSSADKPQEAEAAWARAALSQSWNDYQSDRLLRARDRIAQDVGSKQAWELGYVYYSRSTAAAVLIERYARGILAKADLESDRGLERRFETLRNGYLLRQGSRSMPVGLHGANIVDLASYPGSLIATRSPKKLLLAQIAFYNSLMAVEKPLQTEQAKQAFEVFRDNDGWRYMTQRESYDETAAWHTLVSVFSACLPSALLCAALVGLLLFTAGRALDRHGAPQIPIIAIVGAATASGFLTYSFAHSVLAAIAVALSVAFLSFGPEKSRKARSENVGPLFTFIVWTLALSFFLTFAGFAIGFSTPAITLFPLLGLPGEFFGNRSMFIGLSAIILGLLMLSAPIWAIVQKRTTPFMLGLALRRFGAVLGLTSITMAMIATPVAIYVDRSLDKTMVQLVGNEPLYYLLQ